MNSIKKGLRYGLCLLLMIVLFPPFSSVAFAGGTVSYQGQAEKFIFSPGSEYSPTDLFSDFKNVMPGDSLTQTVEVRNKNSNSTAIKVYMRSLGAETGSEDFLSQMQLRVTAQGGSELFNAPADQKSGLEDWVLLGTLEPGGQVTLDLALDVPITLGNDFQEQIGYLDWQFKIEEIPSSSSKSSGTRTGDENVVAIWVILMIVSAASLIILGNRKRKRSL